MMNKSIGYVKSEVHVVTEKLYLEAQRRFRTCWGYEHAPRWIYGARELYEVLSDPVKYAGEYVYAERER
jgi:hypothetical protein